MLVDALMFDDLILAGTFHPLASDKFFELGRTLKHRLQAGKDLQVGVNLVP